MFGMQRFALALLLSVGAVTALNAASSPEWIRRSPNQAMWTQVARDPDGSIWMASTHHVGLVIQKYSPSGQELVSRYHQFGSPIELIDGLEVAADGSSRALIRFYREHASKSNWGTLLVKLDPQGGMEWAREIETPQGHIQPRGRLATHPDGHTYLTISTYQVGGQEGLNWSTHKLDPDGNPVWQHTFAGPGRADGIATDALGNVYVNGYRGTSLTVACFTSQGTLTWATDYAAQKGQRWAGGPMAVDPSGHVYVAAELLLGLAGSELSVLKIDPNGAILWDRRYHGVRPGNQWPAGLGLDRQGNVCVAATYQYPELPSTGATSDVLTVKYNPEGDLLWERIEDVRGEDAPIALGVNARGDVFVAGLTGSSRSTRNHSLLIQYDREGTRIQRRIILSPPRRTDEANSLVIGSDNAAYVSGLSSHPAAAPSEETFLFRFPALRAPELSALTLGQTRLRGGVRLAGTLTLDAPALEAMNVAITSSNPGLVVVPRNGRRIARGRSFGQFVIRTRPVSTPTTVTITAQYRAQTRTAQLQLVP